MNWLFWKTPLNYAGHAADLGGLRDSIVVMQERDLPTIEYTASKRLFRSLTPRKYSESTAPIVDVDADAEQDLGQLLVLHASSALPKRLSTRAGASIDVDGAVEDFLQRALPEFRLRSEVRLSGWTMDAQDARITACIVTVGSRPTGLLVGCTGGMADALPRLLPEDWRQAIEPLPETMTVYEFLDKF